MLKVGYLGPCGSYSYLAASQFQTELFKAEAELLPYDTFNLVMQALVSGECDYIILPVENSLNGSVNQNIDLLQSTEGVIAFKECTVRIAHRLATLEGADVSKIKRVYSHEQSLAQCAKFLSTNFPRAERIAMPSTTASLKMLKKKSDACIVGSHIKMSGVKIHDFEIADEEYNVTHFLLVKKGDVAPQIHSQKVFFSATCRHKSGALISLLAPLSEAGFNMSKIISRPIKEKAGEYRFFIEVEGDFAEQNMQAALNNVKNAANSFKILGVY